MRRGGAHLHGDKLASWHELPLLEDGLPAGPVVGLATAQAQRRALLRRQPHLGEEVQEEVE